MMESKDRIRVHIEGKEFKVVGGSFQEMLAAVKQINGRRFLSELKVWQLPGAFEEIQRQLDISGYQLEGGRPAAPQETSPPQSQPAPAAGDRIRLVVEGHQVAVVGGSFQDMLAVVKDLPGRRFDGESKTWQVPGELAVIKGVIEAAGFALEGVENISLPPVPPMEPPDFLDPVRPAAPPLFFEAPDFSPEEEIPPFEPPDWWDDMPPPAFEEAYDSDDPMPLEHELFPPQAESPAAQPAVPPASTGDRIRIQHGTQYFTVQGGTFQAMLAVIKNIPGRRFNPADKVWELPADMTLETIRQTIHTAGFSLSPEEAS